MAESLCGEAARLPEVSFVLMGETVVAALREAEDGNARGRGGEEMKVNLTWDEWYPVYNIDTSKCPQEPEFEVPEAQVAEWKRVCAEFDRVQEEMRVFAVSAEDSTRLRKQLTT